MKRTLIIFCVILLLTSWTSPPQLYVNDVPAIADTTTHCLYIPVEDNGEESFTASFRTDGDNLSFIFDGIAVR